MQRSRYIVDVVSCITHFADSRHLIIGQNLTFSPAIKSCEWRAVLLDYLRRRSCGASCADEIYYVRINASVVKILDPVCEIVKN